MLAVDPGPTPGFALYESYGLGAVEEFQAWIEPEWFGAIDRARDEITAGLDALVVESFRINTGTASKTQGAIIQTIEMVGVLRWIAHKRHTPFVLQPPSDAAGFSSPAKLRRIGWWTPGKADHARSATQHLLLYLVRAGAVAPSRVLDSPTTEEEPCP